MPKSLPNTSKEANATAQKINDPSPRIKTAPLREM